MIRPIHITWILVAALVGTLSNGVFALTMETVHVGNPGNAADTRVMSDGTSGYGSVDYSYNIGKYEVTAKQYCEFLNAVAKTDTYGLYDVNMWSNTYGCKIQQSGNSGNYSYSVASDYANRPVNYVSWGDTARFVNWLHNGQPTGAQVASTTEDGAYALNGATSNAALRTVTRKTDWKWAITSENEWYKAAYYKGGSTNAGYWDYPTSCNTAPGQDMTDASGNNANIYIGSGPYPVDSGPNPVDSDKYYTTVVGEFQNSDSPYGTFDQGGNVWEWNESVVHEDSAYSYRGMRGGSFWYYDSDLLASYRYNNYPTYESYVNVGFRVVEVPEPGTITMLMLGGLALLRRKRP